MQFVVFLNSMSNEIIKETFLAAPNRPGQWAWSHNGDAVRIVTVENSGSSGLKCTELQQGGSIHCGFKPWSGSWRYAGEQEAAPIDPGPELESNPDYTLKAWSGDSTGGATVIGGVTPVEGLWHALPVGLKDFSTNAGVRGISDVIKSLMASGPDWSGAPVVMVSWSEPLGFHSIRHRYSETGHDDAWKPWPYGVFRVSCSERGKGVWKAPDHINVVDIHWDLDEWWYYHEKIAEWKSLLESEVVPKNPAIECDLNKPLGMNIWTLPVSLPAFLVGVGSASKHHSELCGLLTHTLEVAKLVVKMYEGLDKPVDPVAVLAALWHDVAKAHDYRSTVGTDGKITNHYTDHADMTRHVVKSWEMFRKSWHRLHGKEAFTESSAYHMMEDVSHAILAHHGRLEWGSPVNPHTEAAWVVHLADMTSANVNGRRRSGY